MALSPGHSMALAQQITMAVTKNFAHKFGNKKVLLNNLKDISVFGWKTQMGESFFPQNNWAFLIAAVASAVGYKQLFLYYIKLLWQWYSGSVMLYACFFFWLIFLCFPFSPHVNHFFSSSMFCTTPPKSDKIILLAHTPQPLVLGKQWLKRSITESDSGRTCSVMTKFLQRNLR